MKKIFLVGCSLLATAISFAQPSVDLTGKQCLSGNCHNGRGRLRLPKMENREYEGTFVNGLLSGEGKAYARSAGGSLYLEQVGRFSQGALESGKIYDESGKELMNGTYRYDGLVRTQANGSRLITCRGKAATLFCADMMTNSTTGKISYSGLVDVYEGTNGRNGRHLSQANYLSGKRHGLAYEWDYDNDVLHYLKYNDGNLVDSAVIKTLSDDKVVGSLVRYVPSESDEFFLNIEQGMFRFGHDERRYIISNTANGTLAYFKQQYDTYDPFDYSIINGKLTRKTTAQVNAMNNQFARPNNNAQGTSGNSNIDLSPMQRKNPGNKYWDQVAKDGIADLSRLTERMDRFYADADRLVKYTIKRNYYSNSDKLDKMRATILKDIEWKIKEWEEKVSPRLISELNDARQRIERKYQMPGPGAFPTSLGD